MAQTCFFVLDRTGFGPLYPNKGPWWPDLGTLLVQLEFCSGQDRLWPTLSENKDRLVAQLAVLFWTGPTLAHFIQTLDPGAQLGSGHFLSQLDFYSGQDPLWPTLSEIGTVFGPTCCFVLDRTDFGPLYPNTGPWGPNWGHFLSQLDFLFRTGPTLAHFIRNRDRLWPNLLFSFWGPSWFRSF